MAVNAETAINDAEVAPKKGKGKLLLITGVVVAVLAAGSIGAYLMRGDKAHAEDGQKEAKATPKTETAPAARKMLYAPMDTFTVNLHDTDREHFLQTTINLQVNDSMTVETIKQQMPAIRNRVLLLLSSKAVEELTTREGKEKLADEIATEVRKSLDGPGPSKGLEQVLFAHFVIQ